MIDVSDVDPIQSEVVPPYSATHASTHVYVGVVLSMNGPELTAQRSTAALVSVGKKPINDRDRKHNETILNNMMNYEL